MAEDDRTKDRQLAALGVIELAMRRKKDPSRTQEHLEELDALLEGVNPAIVAVEVAYILTELVAELDQERVLRAFIEETRARVVGGV